MKFSSFDLHPRLVAGVEAIGWTEPTPIQKQAIPVVLSGRDVLGLAQTGTGKTAAFALPILQRLMTGPLRRTRALIVAPTRELAAQITQDFADLARNTRARSAAVYGGVSIHGQMRALRGGVEIVVACPGRLLDHINRGTVDLSAVEVLVLDEADRMIDMGFLPDIRRILRHLPSERQTLLFSATMPRAMRGLAHEILDRPTTVQVDSTAPAVTVSHAIYPVAQNRKTDLLGALLQGTDTESVLVFTRTKHRAKRLAKVLVRDGYRATSLQGNLSQNRRTEAMSGFRSGQYQIMVATDIAARGIDVATISHVINYDIPDTVEAYTHRIGRTGRAARTGDAFTLVTRDDAGLVRAIERTLGERLERRRLDGFDYDAPPANGAGRSRTERPATASTRPHQPPTRQRRRRRSPSGWRIGESPNAS